MEFMELAELLVNVVEIIVFVLKSVLDEILFPQLFY